METFLLMFMPIPAMGLKPLASPVTGLQLPELGHTGRLLQPLEEYEVNFTL